MPGTCSPRRARPARRRPRRAPRRRPLGRAPRPPRRCPARPPRRRWRPRRRPRRCRPRRPPPRRRRLLPPPRRPPPRPRRRRAAPRPRAPRASHPAPPAPRTPTAARRAAARRARGRSAGRALVRRVPPSGGRGVAAGADHWRVARRSGMRRPMAEAVGERRSGGRQGALLAQYLRIKAQHRRAILLFRLGDFYEMFFEDAAAAARDLDLTRTARNRGAPDEVPLCGFPAHAAQPYITRLLAKGHTVAVCEQAPARGRGLMEREVVRVITPGTILEEESLEPDAPSLLAALAAEEERFGIAVIDFASGAFRATEVHGWELARDELERLAPRELLLAPDLPPAIDAACRTGRPAARRGRGAGGAPRAARGARGGARPHRRPRAARGAGRCAQRRSAGRGAPGGRARAGGRGAGGPRRRPGGAAGCPRRRARSAPRGGGGDRRDARRCAAAACAPPGLHPTRARPGSRRAARDGARREGLARALRGGGAPAHGHHVAQNPPQQGLRLLRRGDAPEPATRPSRLRAAADAGRRRALRDPDPPPARGARARRRGAPAGARGAPLRGVARHRGGAPPDARAHGGREIGR